MDLTGRDYATVAKPPAGLPSFLLSEVTPDDQRTQAVVAVFAALPSQFRPLLQTVTANTPGSVTLGLTAAARSDGAVRTTPPARPRCSRR